MDSQTLNALKQEIANINFAEIKLENENEDRVCTDLNLWDGRNTIAGYADVSWSSDRPDVISTSGEVNSQKTLVGVVLTAHFSFQDYPDVMIDKEFKLYVLAGSGKGAAVPQARFTRTKDCSVVFIAGDSTASPYPHEGVNNRYPQTGWGQVFNRYFDPEKIQIANYAMSGRSSLSFRTETNYKHISDEMQNGDFLIIQFGHNDSKKEDPNRYCPLGGSKTENGSYKNSLMQFVNLARKKGAIPILATSISRRKFKDETLEAYAAEVRMLGKEENIPVIDLYKKTNEWIKFVGLEGAKDLFKYIKPKDVRYMNNPEFKRSQYFETGDTDDTHLTIYGADYVAYLALEEAQRLKLPFSSAYNGYTPKYPLPKYE